ncbi:MAG: ribonuclease D [Ruminococcaceae bacterium]|nr:ribonuclease D [Oscillospiraceae bacterium]
MNNYLIVLENDLSEDIVIEIEKNGIVAIDTETTGLDFLKDSLCTIQLCSKDIQVILKYNNALEYPNLTKILIDKKIIKVFHNAVFDVSFLMKNIDIINVNNIVCTKISSKLINGLKHNNSLKPLLSEYLNIDIDKSYQLSNWKAETLTEGQLLYAMNDVKYLEILWNKMEIQLCEKELLGLANKIFDFIPSYVLLKMKGIDNIFLY